MSFLSLVRRRDSAACPRQPLYVEPMEGRLFLSSSPLLPDDNGAGDGLDASLFALVASTSDTVSGGGVITGTPSGGRATFSASAGIVNGGFVGSLKYFDQNSDLHVVSTAVTGYAVDPNDADCRIADYNVTINGQPGTARIRVCDKGTSGATDVFQMQLSNGYFAGGTLAGGNIKLHG